MIRWARLFCPCGDSQAGLLYLPTRTLEGHAPTPALPHFESLVPHTESAVKPILRCKAEYPGHNPTTHRTVSRRGGTTVCVLRSAWTRSCPRPCKCPSRRHCSHSFCSTSSSGLMLRFLVRIRHKMVWLWSRSAVATAVQSWAETQRGSDGDTRTDS
jgi:hypothetical protein